MRTLLNICVVTILCSVLSSCGSKSVNAVDYNNNFMTVMNEMQIEITQMNTAMVAEDYTKAEEVRQAWDAKIGKALETVKAAGDFKGDASFQEAVLSALTAYQGIVQNDYKKLIEIRTANKDQEEVAEETINAENAALENINNAFEKAANELNDAATKFENEHSK